MSMIPALEGCFGGQLELVVSGDQPDLQCLNNINLCLEGYTGYFVARIPGLHSAQFILRGGGRRVELRGVPGCSRPFLGQARLHLHTPASSTGHLHPRDFF